MKNQTKTPIDLSHWELNESYHVLPCELHRSVGLVIYEAGATHTNEFFNFDEKLAIAFSHTLDPVVPRSLSEKRHAIDISLLDETTLPPHIVSGGFRYAITYALAETSETDDVSGRVGNDSAPELTLNLTARKWTITLAFLFGCISIIAFIWLTTRPKRNTDSQAGLKTDAKVDIQFEDVSLPLAVRINDKDHLLYRGNHTIKDVPTGNNRFEIQPAIYREFIQLVDIQINNRSKGSIGGTFPLEIEENDEVRFRCQTPLSPWNSVLHQVNGEHFMLNFLAPDPGYKPPRKLRPNEPINTIAAWASIGVDQAPALIAKEIVSKRAAGEFSPTKGTFAIKKLKTRIVLPLKEQGKLAEPFASLTESELEKIIREAANRLLKKRHPTLETSFEKLIQTYKKKYSNE